MSRLVISGEYPQICSELEKKGFDIIRTDTVAALPKPEQRHADMQVLPLGDIIFILRECGNLISELPEGKAVICESFVTEEYPGNVILNFLLFNGRLYGKLSALDNSVKEYYRERGIEVVNINQGYARCSALIINNRAVITADKSIAKALSSDGAEVLLIQPGHIRLEGYDYGFIGGASGSAGNGTVYFFGNVKAHPDYNAIRAFIERNDSRLEILCPEMPLTDIGGVVII